METRHMGWVDIRDVVRFPTLTESWYLLFLVGKGKRRWASRVAAFNLVSTVTFINLS